MADGAVPLIPAVPDGPPAELLYRRRLNLVASIRELWASRELVRTLTERSIRSRYKQTVLGFAWSLITPVLLMVVFTVVFKRVAKIDTGDIPYPIFSYVGLLPWTFFSGSVSSSGTVIIANNSLLNKVYCPREVFPISTITASAFDTTCAMAALVVLFVVTGFAPTIGILWTPLLTVILLMFTLGVCLLLSALTVYARDLRYGLPIALQLGLFATPVAYSFYDMVPKEWRPLYSAINPLGPVVQGYRDTLLLGLRPQFGLLAIAAAASVVYVVVGFVVFKRLEPGFSDVA